jgi:hypothetical protein
MTGKETYTKLAAATRDLQPGSEFSVNTLDSLDL